MERNIRDSHNVKKNIIGILQWYVCSSRERLLHPSISYYYKDLHKRKPFYTANYQNKYHWTGFIRDINVIRVPVMEKYETFPTESLYLFHLRIRDCFIVYSLSI